MDIDELLKILDAMPPEARKELEETVDAAIGTAPFIPNPGAQTDALLSEADILLFGGGSGGGKLLCKNSHLATAFGMKRCDKLKVGDRILHPSGQTQRIIQLKPWVKLEKWVVHFHDGTKYECAADHLWQAWKSGKSVKRGGKKVCAEPEVIETRELKEWLDKAIDQEARGVRPNWPLIPVCHELPFNVTGKWKDRRLDPYLIGALLGDGTITTESVALTIADYDVERISAYLSQFSYTIIDGVGCKNFRFTGDDRKKIVNELERLGLLGTRSNSKFIPKENKLGTIDERWALVQGLMDTDGYADELGHLEYVTVSKQLADDLAWVLRSLGSTVVISEKETHYRDADGNKVPCQNAFRLYIKHREPWKMFRCEKKLDRAKNKADTVMHKRVVRIEVGGEIEGRCLTVSNPDGLYIADDFVVTHNSALEVGCPSLYHHTGIIFRREATQLDGLIAFSHEVFEKIPDASYNKVEKLWTWGDGKSLKFAGLQQADDWRKHAGNARDYMAFDEAGEFLKEQVFSLFAWLRTTRPDQRCRIILGTNPPRGGDGQWLLEEFDPWIKAERTHRAQPGELRWSIIVRGKTVWVDGPGEHIVDGEPYIAMSRTFIPSLVADNPYLANDKGYRARVMALPEPLRSQLLYGDFTADQEDDEKQVIPSEWVRLAQARWIDTPPDDIPMTAVASDIAQGGADRTVVQARHGAWFGHFHTVPGSQTPDGMTAASEIMKQVKGQCRVVVDAGGGYGGDALTKLAEAGIECYGFVSSTKSTRPSRNGLYKFRNFKAEALWALRDALDPNNGDDIALPPDPELLVELCAFRVKEWKSGASSVAQQVVELEPKDKVKERLGRSPDKADTTIMLHYSHAVGLRKPRVAQMREQMAAQQPQRILGGTSNLRKGNNRLDRLRGKGRK